MIVLQKGEIICKNFSASLSRKTVCERISIPTKNGSQAVAPWSPKARDQGHPDLWVGTRGTQIYGLGPAPPAPLLPPTGRSGFVVSHPFRKEREMDGARKICGTGDLWNGRFVERKICGTEDLWNGRFVEREICGTEDLWKARIAIARRLRRWERSRFGTRRRTWSR